MALAWLALLAAVLGLGALLAGSARHRGPHAAGLATNPALDSGNKLSGPAPGFTLTDQFGRRVALSSFRDGW